MCSGCTNNCQHYLSACLVHRIADRFDFQVNLCVSNNIPFLATGGGHGYSTSFGELENGIQLDLGGFKTVEVDKEASTLTVGGAVTFQDVYEPLYAAGKEIRKAYSCFVSHNSLIWSKLLVPALASVLLVAHWVVALAVTKAFTV